MKGLKRAVVAATAVTAVMASALAVSASAPEWNNNGGQQSVHGDTYVEVPEIEIELPGELAFGVNPLKINVSEETNGTDRRQILSGSYLITNLSEVPVAVSASTVIKNKTDLAVVTGTGTSWPTGTWDDQNKSELKSVANKKAVLLLQLYPKTIDNTGKMTMTAPSLGGETSNAKPNAIVGDILSTTAPAKPVSFVLNAYDESKANESMGGFEFGGAVDPKATFNENDIEVETTFTMNILTDAQKTKKYQDHTTNASLSLTSTGSTAKVHSTVKEAK